MIDKIIKNMKSGYTLSEALLTLAVIAALAAITTPIISNSLPDKNAALYKKGVYALEHTISDLVNDDYLYPEKKTITPNGDGTNTVTITHGLSNTSAVTVNGVTYSGDSKFCDLFASRFNLYPGSSVNCDNDSMGFKSDGRTPTFISNDGIQWLVHLGADNNYYVAFRTSMEDDTKAPHCGVNNNGILNIDLRTMFGFNSSLNSTAGKGTSLIYSATNTASNCKHPDTFVFTVYPNGKVVNPYALDEKVKTSY